MLRRWGHQLVLRDGPLTTPARIAGALVGAARSVAHSADVVKWSATSQTTAWARALEPAEEHREVAPPADLGAVAEDMRRAGYVEQALWAMDTFPSPQRVWWRFCQKPSAEQKTIVDALRAAWKRKPPATRGAEPTWHPPIGDCQSFAVLAASRLAKLPPTCDVGLIRILSVRGLKADGALFGHAVAAWQGRHESTWQVMARAGRMGPYASLRDAVAAVCEAHGASPLWWAELAWSTLALMRHAEYVVEDGEVS